MYRMLWHFTKCWLRVFSAPTGLVCVCVCLCVCVFVRARAGHCHRRLIRRVGIGLRV